MPNAITIRRFEAGDADEVSRLIIDNLLQVNIHDYGEAVVKQLARFYGPEFLLNYAQAGEMYVALAGSGIVGTATLQEAWVRNVFVRVDHHRRGIGQRLIGHIEDAACRQAMARLALRANVAAVDFYQKLGYRLVEAREEKVGDALLKTMVMEKILPSPEKGDAPQQKLDTRT